jgi:hypothetical protein
MSGISASAPVQFSSLIKVLFVDFVGFFQDQKAAMSAIVAQDLEELKHIIQTHKHRVDNTPDFYRACPLAATDNVSVGHCRTC